MANHGEGCLSIAALLDDAIAAQAKRLADMAFGRAKWAAIGALPATANHPVAFPVTVTLDIAELEEHYRRALSGHIVRSLVNDAATAVAGK